MYLLNLACYCILNFFQVYIYHYYSLQYYYKSVKEIINYVRNPIQLQGGTKIFYIYMTKKKIYIYFVVKKYRQVSAIFTNTDTTSQYHKNRPIPPILILKYWYITTHYFLLHFSCTICCFITSTRNKKSCLTWSYFNFNLKHLP